MGKYFGTDGFRGEANIGLTVEHAFKVGRYLGWYFGQEHKARIVIGKDTRRSSYMFEYALAAGLTASGADAYLLHVTTTPSVSYVTSTEDFDCGIMISASHNPFYDNGIKLINGKGYKMEAEVENQIEAYIDGETKEITFYWRAEDWIKDPAAWEASYGSSLLEKLTVCEAKEEETTEEKSTEEKSIEESSTEEASSEKATTESVSSEPSTTIEATSKESISSEETTQTQEQESTTPLQTPEATTLLPSSETVPTSAAESTTLEQVIETPMQQSETSLPEIQQTMEEESPAPVQEAKIERKNVILRAAAPSLKSFLFEVKAVLTITSTVLADGSTQYQFTLLDWV